jgi:hypothetical protein
MRNTFVITEYDRVHVSRGDRCKFITLCTPSLSLSSLGRIPGSRPRHASLNYDTRFLSVYQTTAQVGSRHDLQVFDHALLWKKEHDAASIPFTNQSTPTYFLPCASPVGRPSVPASTRINSQVAHTRHTCSAYYLLLAFFMYGNHSLLHSWFFSPCTWMHGVNLKVSQLTLVSIAGKKLNEERANEPSR